MEAALSVENLRAYYLMRYFGVVREVRAVDDISLEVKRNEIYGLAGESSSGKTTFIKTIAAAIRPPLEVVSGSIKYSFLDRDIYGLSPEALSAIRWKHLSYITQGSMNVLNPIRRVRQSFIDFALRHMGRSKREFFEIVDTHLARLHLAPTVLNAYPHELSGGMRQRIAIALATICRPEFIIADEPTTALDVIVQKSVLRMIREAQQELGSSMIFVTHDLTVHANIADRLGIMYAGRLVEEAPTTEIFHHPMHPYTTHLVGSLPRIGDSTPRESAFGGAAEPRQSAEWMPVPPALSACHGHLPPGPSRAHDASGQPPGRLLCSQSARQAERRARRPRPLLATESRTQGKPMRLVQ